MLEKAAANALVFGALMVALGLIPGPLAALMRGIENLRNLSSSLSQPLFQLPEMTKEEIPGQAWIALGGALTMLLGALLLLMR